jgi:hypothetical protein
MRIFRTLVKSCSAEVVTAYIWLKSRQRERERQTVQIILCRTNLPRQWLIGGNFAKSFDLDSEKSNFPASTNMKDVKFCRKNNFSTLCFSVTCSLRRKSVRNSKVTNLCYEVHVLSHMLIMAGRMSKMDHGENCIMMSFMVCILRRILLGWLNQGGWCGLDMWHAWGRGEVLTGFWLGRPIARGHWEDLGVGGRITLKWTLGR